MGLVYVGDGATQHRRLPRRDQLRGRAAAARSWWWSRTTATPIPRRSPGRPRCASWSTRRRVTGSRACRPTATTCWRCTKPPGGPWTGRAPARGVTLVELITYRRKGHAEHDNQSYVPEDEIEAWEARDPIDRYVRRLTEQGWARPEDAPRDRYPDRRRDRRRGGRVRARAASRPPTPPWAACCADPPRRAARVVPEALMAEVTYLEAIRQGLFEEMERDDRVLRPGRGRRAPSAGPSR